VTVRFGAKFGVDLPTDPADLILLARAVEELGFASFWVGDHVVIPRSIDHEAHTAQVGGGAGVRSFGDKTNIDVFDPILALTYIAPEVTRIALGLSVLVIPYRNPLLCAKMLATLDVFSSGRLIVGAGVGWMREEFTALRADYDARGAVTDEYLQLMIELWTSDDPTFAGEHYDVANISFLPKPVQRPHPPVWVGGNGLPAMRRAVRFGQGWMPNFVTPDELQEKLATLDQMMAAANREPGSLSIAVGCRFAFATEGRPAGRPILTGRASDMIDDIRRFEDAGAAELVVIGDQVRDVRQLVDGLHRFADEVIAAL
jgi:probable F420-dependent oxidoreductase